MRLSYRSGGESHGKGMVAILEGLPKGLAIDTDAIDAQLARRQRGYGRSGRQQIERDRVEILGGVRHGKTLDAPLVLFVANKDTSIEAMPEPTRPRPGHADLAGCYRHGDRDIRANIERSSARETCARVAAGAVAQQLLAALGAEVLGHVIAIGDAFARDPSEEPGSAFAGLESFEHARAAIAASDFGVLDSAREPVLRAAIDAAIRDKDSLGGVVEVVARGVPPGLGSFAQWDQRVDGRLAQALLSIPAFKSVGIGLGHVAAQRPGSRIHDEIGRDGSRLVRRTNAAGGIEGGVTNGQLLVVRGAKKPIATLRQRLASVDLVTGDDAPAAFERSDVCAVPAAACIAEAMVALVLADAALELYGGATMSQFVAAHERHAREVARIDACDEAGDGTHGVDGPGPVSA